MGLPELAIASLATSVMGTGMSVVGGIQQGQQQKKAAQAQAQVAANNAATAEQNAKDAIVAGQNEEQRARMEHNQRLGALRAEAGASGIDVGTGSALDAMGDASMMKEIDSLSIRDQAARTANNYYQQAADFTTQGNMAMAAGKSAAANGRFGAAGSLLTGAGKVAGSWYQYKKDKEAESRYQYKQDKVP